MRAETRPAIVGKTATPPPPLDNRASAATGKLESEAELARGDKIGAQRAAFGRLRGLWCCEGGLTVH